MASTDQWLSTVKASLLGNGFFDMEDTVVGERFEDLERRGTRLATPYGVDFLKTIVLHPVR